MLNVIDDCTRECLCIEVSTGFSGQHVKRVVERLCQQLGRPEVIRSDNYGRNSAFALPPAQIPACGFPAPGSSLRVDG
jgi:transposase InsO family protein